MGDSAVHGWPVVSGEITGTSGDLLGNFDGDSFNRASIRFRVLPGSLHFAFY
jgi:hypothetical protein